MIYLSYVLDGNTPSYGNRNKFILEKKSAIAKADVANDSYMKTTVHIGTHIDMPYHFYENGQTIEDFNADFWIFKKPLIIEIDQTDLIIKDRLLQRLQKVEDAGYDMLIVKTGICYKRGQKAYWSENYGFHPDVYDFLISKFKSIRVLGFDSISVSSIQDRMLGREAHKRFLNPKLPILLLEDMDLREVTEQSTFSEILVSPLRIAECDGLPCTVFGKVDD
jgi:kynurenine formamidase